MYNFLYIYYMSIATLKKKVQSQYRNLSVGQPHFSINGTHRSQGYVGQTMLSRSLPRTLMNGIYPRGHGGCCGKFPINRIIQSAVTSLEDPKIIKNSPIISTDIIEKNVGCTYKFNNKFIIKRNNIVKPDNNNNNNSQQDYIKKKSKNAIQKINKCTSLNQIKNKTKCSMTNTYFNRIQKPICNYTKPESDYIPISQSENILNKNKLCINNDEIPTKNVNKTPFGCGL